MSGGAQPFGDPGLLPAGYFQEPVAGLLLIEPLCVAGVFLPFLILWKKEWCPAEVRSIVGALVAAGLAMFAVVITTPSASARYELDFVPALLLAGIFLGLLLSVRFRAGWMRAASAAVTAAGCCWAAAATMALSVNSYGYPLERPNSPLFHYIASAFGAAPDAFMKDVDELHIAANIVFADVPPKTREAILSSGIYERWDLLMLQYEAGGKAMFASVHAGVSDSWAPAVALAPGTPRRLTVDYAAASKRLRVGLDGQTVLDFPAVLYPTSRDRITPGKLLAGRFDVRDFSGKIAIPAGGLTLTHQR
jgi:hypothetical protein